jgi:hypothetical protein
LVDRDELSAKAETNQSNAYRTCVGHDKTRSVQGEAASGSPESPDSPHPASRNLDEA